MKARIPIYARVLGWFFINLTVLVCIAWMVVCWQFRLNLFTSTVTLDRVENAAIKIAAELNVAPLEKWNEIIATHEQKLGVQLYCYDGGGKWIAGQKTFLPPDVHSRIAPPRPPSSPEHRPAPRPRPFDLHHPQFQDGLHPQHEDFPMPEEPPPHRPPPPDSAPIRHGNAPARVDARMLVQTETPRRYWVLIRQELQIHGRKSGAVIIASSDSPTGNGLYFELRPLLLAGLGVLVLSALIWFPFVRRLTRDIGQMRDATASLAEGKFEVRVSDKRRDELGELGTGINRMAERLSGYVHGQKRFLGDVAHELCAPIARLQMALSILEQRASQADGERLADVREEVEHMTELVNELLQFSRASIGGKKAALRPVKVREIVEKSIRRETGDTSQVQMEIHEALLAKADPDLLHRALGNLIRNAIHYAGHAGPITISSEQAEKRIFIRVADCGPGVPPSALPRLFDPLFRVDEARTRENGGVGLGLAIVKTCVDACEGTVSAKNLVPCGLEITLELEAA